MRRVTIKEAATRLGKSELTIRRMVKTGKLPARLENRPPWGPTYVIDESDLCQVMSPPPSLITVLPPETVPSIQTSEQMIRRIREGVLVDIHQAFTQLQTHVTAQLQSEITRLQGQVRQLTDPLADAAQEQKRQGEAHDRWLLQALREALQEQSPRRPWWPWRR